jgi:hypothetical protein
MALVVRVMANAASAVRATAMDVIAAKEVSAQIAARKKLLKASFLSQISL